MDPSRPRRKAPDPAVVEANLGALDRAIFRHLPNEGANVGYKPLYRTSSALADCVNEGVPAEGQVSAQAIGARLRVLCSAGFVVHVRKGLASGAHGGWQRTPKAVAWLGRSTDDGRA